MSTEQICFKTDPINYVTFRTNLIFCHTKSRLINKSMKVTSKYSIEKNMKYITSTAQKSCPQETRYRYSL